MVLVLASSVYSVLFFEMQLFFFLRVISLEAMVHTSTKISNTVTLITLISPTQQQTAE
jgi:hypothetical protein